MWPFQGLPAYFQLHRSQVSSEKLVYLPIIQYFCTQLWERGRPRPHRLRTRTSALPGRQTEVNSDKRRHTSSYILLTLYLSLMVLMSVHIHPQGAYDHADCYQCANHLPHSGHLSAAQAAMHACLLCQLQGSIYGIGAVVVLSVVLPVVTASHGERRLSVVAATVPQRCPRAPPVL